VFTDGDRHRLDLFLLSKESSVRSMTARRVESPGALLAE